MKARRRQFLDATTDAITDFGALDEPPHVHCYLTHCLAAAAEVRLPQHLPCRQTRRRHRRAVPLRLAVVGRSRRGAPFGHLLELVEN